MARSTGERSLIEWLESITAFIEQLHRHEYTDDLLLADRLCGRCDDYLLLLQALQRRGEEELAANEDNSLHQLVADIQAVAAYIASRAEHFRDWVLHLVDEHSGPGDASNPPIRIYTGGRGRPAYYVPQSQIEAMMELRFTYEKMARLLHISTRTLQRRRQEFGLPIGRNYTDITDDELDATIRSVLQVGYILLCIQWHLSV